RLLHRNVADLSVAPDAKREIYARGFLNSRIHHRLQPIVGNGSRECIDVCSVTVTECSVPKSNAGLACSRWKLPIRQRWPPPLPIRHRVWRRRFGFVRGVWGTGGGVW